MARVLEEQRTIFDVCVRKPTPSEKLAMAKTDEIAWVMISCGQCTAAHLADKILSLHVQRLLLGLALYAQEQTDLDHDLQ